MKICLLNPKTNVLIDDAVMPPLGLWYVSAAIRAAGHEVVISDMVFDDPIPKDADVYGITGTTPQAGRMQRLVERVKVLNPSARIIAGGPHATVAPEEVLQYGCETVVCGEAEEVIADVLENGTGGIVVAPRIQKLDRLPLPDRSRAERYNYTIDDLPATTIMTSRGCPYGCAFCSKPFGRRLYIRSVKNIMHEVHVATIGCGFEALMFFDDTLGIHRSRLLELCGEMEQTGIVWRCFLRGHQVTEQLAMAMRDGGCVEVGIGVESGSDRILENIHKGETVAEIEAGIRTLQRTGIRAKGFFIVGLPGEDPESLGETEAFLERVPLDDVDFTIFSPYPGSPIYANPDSYDVQWENTMATYYKADPAKYACAVRTSALAGWELLNARRHLESRFKRWR